MTRVCDEFVGAPDPYWRRRVTERATLEPHDVSVRFVLEACTSRHYEDAQIDDYQGLARRQFAWSPPLHLGVKARFSHPKEDLQDDNRRQQRHHLPGHSHRVWAPVSWDMISSGETASAGAI